MFFLLEPLCLRLFCGFLFVFLSPGCSGLVDSTSASERLERLIGNDL